MNVAPIALGGLMPSAGFNSSNGKPPLEQVTVRFSRSLTV